VLVVAALLDRGFLAGIDAIKRELGFLAAGLAYGVLGPDRWALPRTSRRSASDGGSVGR
jgi:hypothetical protein